MNGKPRTTEERKDDEKRHFESLVAPLEIKVSRLESDLRDRNNRIDQLCVKLNQCELGREEYVKRKIKEVRARHTMMMRTVRAAHRNLTKAILQEDISNGTKQT
ncbi:unnamed protein product [marine sediment metagenome]|uniref:Uncharacterized protein n=1 Tax=marine sediment metagenome TaxID=412755 RepID=X0SW76_9ZZZZ